MDIKGIEQGQRYHLRLITAQSNMERATQIRNRKKTMIAALVTSALLAAGILAELYAIVIAT